MASWFNPDSTSTVPAGWAENYETAILENATCASNVGIPLQVAKSFWDWDDHNDEDGVGAAAGKDDESANRQTQENDRDGVNVRDYIANTDTEWWGGDATLAETLRDHNCLTSQDNN
jgi:hypothetical protein